MKKNCWEIKKCGKEKQLPNQKGSVVCPAAMSENHDRVNDGINAGRICWRVTGTYCDGETQASYVYKAMNCLHCEVYHQIRKEEGIDFQL